MLGKTGDLQYAALERTFSHVVTVILSHVKDVEEIGYGLAF
jgi:hypothetical protein